jgi:hypothetical protein
MKRLFLISLITLVTLGSLLGHEVTANLSIQGDADGDGSDARGFYLGKACLVWGTDDYSVELDYVSHVNQPDEMVIASAWKRVDMWKLVNLTVGKKQSVFGRIRSSKGSKNVQVFALPQSYTDWMVQLDRSFGNVHTYAQVMWPGIGSADAGGRLSYETKALTMGGAVNVRNLEGDDDDMVNGRFMNWEADLEFTLSGAVTIAGQVTNCDDNNDDTDDMNAYGIISMTKGFELPYVNKRFGRMFYGTIHPYAGLITKDDADGNGLKENNIIAGAKLQAFEGTYIKGEVNMDSIEDTDLGLVVQLGYTF